MKKIKIKKNTRKLKTKSKSDPLSGDLSQFVRSHEWQEFDQHFELLPKTKSITLRISQELLNQLKSLAKTQGVDYQKLIRGAISDLIRKKAS